jgi:hypothetical protein
MPLNSYSFRRRLIEEGRFGVQRNDSETEKDVTEQTEKA